MAYAIGGKGNTVLRGGWGRYYFHSGQFTTGLDVSAGMQTVNLANNQGLNGGPLLAKDIDNLSFPSQALSTGAVDDKNNRDPDRQLQLRDLAAGPGHRSSKSPMSATRRETS